jgi:hypothetical protein
MLRNKIFALLFPVITFKANNYFWNAPCSPLCRQDMCLKEVRDVPCYTIN